MSRPPRGATPRAGASRTTGLGALILWAVLGGASGTACGGPGRSANTDTPQSTPRATDTLAERSAATGTERRTVLIEGTSLTAGLGLDPDEAYPALLQHKIDSTGLPFVVENAGLSGETSAGALRRVEWLMRGPIDVFVLEAGANDGLRGLDVDSTRGNIVGVIRAVRRSHPAARICLVQMEAPPNMGPRYTAAFRELYPSVARGEGVTLFPFLLRGVAGRSDLNQADGIHPNLRGERIVAATVWEALAPVLRAAAGGPTPAGSGGAARTVDAPPSAG
jgi:acyl-CoA thioesterase-1